MGIVSETFGDFKDISMRTVLILSIFLGVFGTLVQTFDVDGLKRMDPRSKVVEMRVDFDDSDESSEEVMSRRIHSNLRDDDYGEDYYTDDDEILSRFDDLDSGFDDMGSETGSEV